jgi:hypothetical protein
MLVAWFSRGLWRNSRTCHHYLRIWQLVILQARSTSSTTSTSSFQLTTISADEDDKQLMQRLVHQHAATTLSYSFRTKKSTFGTCLTATDLLYA